MRFGPGDIKDNFFFEHSSLIYKSLLALDHNKNSLWFFIMANLVPLVISIFFIFTVTLAQQSDDEAVELFLQEYCATDNGSLDEQFERVIKCRSSEAVSMNDDDMCKAFNCSQLLNFFSFFLYSHFIQMTVTRDG